MAQSVSIADRARIFDADGAVIAAHFVGDTAAFVLAEESALLVAPDGELRTIALHAGAILSTAGDFARVVTSGDDGIVRALDADGNVETLAADAKKRWIDHVALAPDGSLGWSAGKQVFVSTKKREPRMLECAATPGGLAFMPKGLRLAIAHYNGVSLWFANAQAAPDILPWKGVHHGVIVSPDGKYVLTAMQEPTLHGWRVSDKKDMRMSGYATRVRSMAWTAKGEFLATGGSDQLILWPFTGKDGPMGRQPALLAPYSERLSVVACHPKQDIVAVGFEDGLILLVRIGDGGEIIVRRPGGGAASALAWNATGTALAFATDGGSAGLMTF